MVCSNSKMHALPLYNKAAFLIHKDGRITLERANLYNGFSLSTKNNQSVNFLGDCRNNEKEKGPVFYDLLYKNNVIKAKDRVLYRLVGNKVIERIEGETTIEVIPVGLVLSFPKNEDLQNIGPGSILNFVIKGLETVVDAIEAGPMIVSNNEVDIKMDLEGWTTENSIRTQAARLDYIDMRGPKIAVGITNNQELIVVAINGRIRESVGATHVDMANILKKLGSQEAMGFDPGGSTTLVVNGIQQNISPYNKDYESNIYSLPPTPRNVGNAVLGFL
jgi:hypothetical protein